MKFDELISSLLTFEMEIYDKSKKGKRETFKVDIVNHEY